MFFSAIFETRSCLLTCLYSVQTLFCFSEPEPKDRKASLKPGEPESAKETTADTGVIPTIKIRKPAQDVPLGQSVDVEVSFTGEPRPTLTYSLDGTEILPSRRIRIEETKREMRSTFTITKTEATDSGTYTITAKSKSGTATAEFTLKVLGKSGPPRNATFTEITTTDATITWSPPADDGGSPIKTYVVYKRMIGKTWQRVVTTKETTFTFTDFLQNTKYEAKIVPVTDLGDGEAVEIGPVTLKDLPPKERKPSVRPDGLPDVIPDKYTEKLLVAPTIRVRKSSDEVAESSTVELEVTFTGEPRPSVAFFLSGAPVSESRKIRIEEFQRDMRVLLTIRKVDESDAGTYTVTATNSAGDATADYTLKILKKPGKPENFVTDEVKSTAVTLTWEPPTDDGGRPVNQYILYKRVSGRTSWQKVTTTRSVTTIATVSELLPNSMYDFKVTAETEQGEGEGNEIIAVRTAEPATDTGKPPRPGASGVVEQVPTGKEVAKPPTKPTVRLDKSTVTSKVNQLIQVRKSRYWRA